MKTINVTFEDAEFQCLNDIKDKVNWHDFIMQAAGFYKLKVVEAKNG